MDEAIRITTAPHLSALTLERLWTLHIGGSGKARGGFAILEQLQDALLRSSVA